MKYNNLIFAGLAFYMGLQITKNGHQYLPVEPKVEGNVVELEYRQKSPASSKLLSFLCLGISGYFIYRQLNSASTEVSFEKSPSVSPSYSVAIAPQPSSVPSFESEDEKIEEVKPTKKPVYVDDGFDFDAIAPTVEKKEEIPMLPKIVLEHTLNANSCKHLLIASLPGSGKTTFLTYMMKYLFDELDGQIDYFCSSAKIDTWLGIHNMTGCDGRPMLLCFGMEKDIPLLADRMVGVQAKIMSRQEDLKAVKMQGGHKEFTPLIIVMDEWIVSQMLLADYDSKYKTNYLEIITSIMKYIIIIGRETNVILWAFGQSHQVQNLGSKVFNSGLQTNLGVLILGSKEAQTSIEQACNDPKFISNKEKREELWMKAQSQIKQNKFIAYSNIGGHRILECPYIPPEIRARMKLTDSSSLNETNIVPFKKQKPEITDPWEASNVG